MRKIILSMAISSLITTNLHAVNSIEIFPDRLDYLEINGVKVRKGTIKSTYENSFELDKLLSNRNSEESKIKKIIEDQKPISEGLYATEYFEILPLEICLKDIKRQGRIMIAVLVMQKVPKTMNKEIKQRLFEVKNNVHPLLAGEIDKLLI